MKKRLQAHKKLTRLEKTRDDRLKAAAALAAEVENDGEQERPHMEALDDDDMCMYYVFLRSRRSSVIAFVAAAAAAAAADADSDSGGWGEDDAAAGRGLMATDLEIKSDFDKQSKQLEKDMHMKQEEKRLKGDVRIELQIYIDQCTSHKAAKWGDSPLRWWAQLGQHSFPWCARLARRDLAVFGSQASVERIFSHCGRLVSKQRAAMKPSTVERMAFLYFNNKMIKYV
jgi:hypothetical protein